MVFYGAYILNVSDFFMLKLNSARTFPRGKVAPRPTGTSRMLEIALFVYFMTFLSRKKNVAMGIFDFAISSVGANIQGMPVSRVCSTQSRMSPPGGPKTSPVGYGFFRVCFRSTPKIIRQNQLSVAALAAHLERILLKLWISKFFECMPGGRPKIGVGSSHRFSELFR